MKQLFEWVPADINNLPKAKNLQRVSVLLDETPTVLIYAGDKWHWYEDPCGPEYYDNNNGKEYQVSDDSWEYVKFLTEFHPSIPLGDLSVFMGTVNKKHILPAKIGDKVMDKSGKTRLIHSESSDGRYWEVDYREDDGGSILGEGGFVVGLLKEDVIEILKS